MRLIYELLPELRDAKGWSVARLSAETSPYGNVAAKTIEALERPINAGRVPKAEYLEAFAEALGVEPGAFYEWPIAAARRDRPTTPAEIEAAKARLRARLREAAQRRHEHPGTGRGTTEPHEHHEDEAL